jgi:hypothetical protein
MMFSLYPIPPKCERVLETYFDRAIGFMRRGLGSADGSTARDICTPIFDKAGALKTPIISALKR